MFNPDTLIANAIVQSVECRQCGKLHLVAGDNYLVIAGDVYHGRLRKLVGDNIDSYHKVVSSWIICRDVACLHKTFNIVDGEEDSPYSNLAIWHDLNEQPPSSLVLRPMAVVLPGDLSPAVPEVDPPAPGEEGSNPPEDDETIDSEP